MKYAVIRKKTLLISASALCLAVVGAVGFWLWKAAGSTAAASANAQGKLPIYCVQTEEKKISLGINCAWDDAQLDQWLQILQQHDATATFFVVGDWCEKYPEALKKISDAGHEIGNHSDTHPDMTKLSDDQIREELKGASQKIQTITGKTPTLFRAPSGAYNDAVINTAEKLGYTCIQWNVDSIDWKGPTAEQIQERVLQKLKPGSITLFHLGKQNSLDALDGILTQAQEQGYSFVPVSQLIYKENFHLNASGKQIPDNSSDPEPSASSAASQESSAQESESKE